MPIKRCATCKRLQTIPADEWKYLDNTGPYICSKQCLLEWIATHQLPRKAMLKATYLERDRGNEEYSEKLKLWFRSKYEKYVAEDLVAFGCAIRYEEVGFIIGRTSVYIPDFFILDHCLIEVKGKWGVGGKTKMRNFREEYPDIPLIVIPWNLKDEFYEGRENVIR